MKLGNYISTQAFWDIDFNTLDASKHKDYIIQKVFNHGKWDDIINIVRIYGKADVKKSLLNTDFLNEQALQLASIIFKTPKSDFKCSTKKQYRPSLKSA